MGLSRNLRRRRCVPGCMNLNSQEHGRGNPVTAGREVILAIIDGLSMRRHRCRRGTTPDLHCDKARRFPQLCGACNYAK